MRQSTFLATFAATLVMCGSAYAADKNMCGTGMVCANTPKTVVAALQKAGYKAVLEKDNDGDPVIKSAASGYNFVIFFYDCAENKNCASLQFNVSFSPEDSNTVELANKWNSSKRFGQMAVAESKALTVSFDLSTLGGLNETNFADQIDWWAVTLGELPQFFREN